MVGSLALPPVKAFERWWGAGTRPEGAAGYEEGWSLAILERARVAGCGRADGAEVPPTGGRSSGRSARPPALRPDWPRGSGTEGGWSVGTDP